VKGKPPFDCPNCGAEVPAGTKSCPECGSDEKTGWNEDAAIYDGAGLEVPSEFNHDEWMKKEGLAATRASGKQIVIIIAALLLLVAVGAFLLRR
jgi:RNA polymerase subunit RPABC4/transcription elongation factor Spt4